MKCLKCNSEYCYEFENTLICPECGFEKKIDQLETNQLTNDIYDANNNVLSNGDTITIVKDLKVKGSNKILKTGTKVKNIQLVFEGDHNINCKIPEFGNMQLKSEFVKKSNK